jgi:hypothetical protein
METPLSSDILAVAALITSLGTFAATIINMVNSFRNSRKIDDTHDIAKQTFNQTQRVYIPALKTSGDKPESD